MIILNKYIQILITDRNKLKGRIFIIYRMYKRIEINIKMRLNIFLLQYMKILLPHTKTIKIRYF
jgi:hypothetical protein